MSSEPPLQPVGPLLSNTKREPRVPSVSASALVTSDSDAGIGDGGGSGKKRPSRSGGSRGRRFLRSTLRWTGRLMISLFALALGGVVVAYFVIKHFEAGLPDVSDLKANYHPSQVTRVLARDGTLLSELFTERRTVVQLADLPAHVKLAVLAAEDAGFYEHDGLNYWGMARAIAVNLRHHGTRQGASTITQQVVKVMLLDPERTYSRKIREALLARKLEQELTKDQILELYINQVNFGHGRYGIEEAARYNFGKSAKQLTIAEAAMMAGVLPNPEGYSPKKDMTKSLQRRAFVLLQMHEKGFLNDAQYDAAKDEPVHLSTAPGTIEGGGELCPEIVDYVKKLLKELDPENAAKGGYVVTTTIDPRLQAAARKSLQTDLEAYDKRHGDAALKAPPMTASATPPAAGKGKTAKKTPAPPPQGAPFEGTPIYEQHKTYVGVVTSADDATGTFDVRVGTVLGTVKLADFDRYNPTKLAATAFAPVGARVRVTLLAAPAYVPPMPPAGVPTTPIDPTMPAIADVARVPLRLEEGPEGALVAIDTRTRNVLALVGSYENVSGGLDRAMQSKRQPGSTFKPIVYSYALHSRLFTPATLVDVNPAKFAGGYSPSNYEGWTGHDPVRLRDALANSINVVAVHVLDEVGPENVVPWAQALGITSTLKPDLSLALGSYEVAPIELAAAYTTFAAGGRYDEPRLITRIQGPDGKDVALPPPPPQRIALDEAEAYVMTSMLESVVDHGTAVKAKELHRPVAGKTGTSNQSKDAWFAGYSTEIAAVVWVGYDDGKPLGASETGASAALPAWIGFMKAAHDHKPPSEFPRPEGVVAVQINKKTGMLPAPDTDPDQIMDEVFLKGTEPTSSESEDDGGAIAPSPSQMQAPAPVLSDGGLRP